jgi:DNA-3-methyladenine glycosylase I
LLRDPSIVRNRLKLESAVNNARRILDVHDELGSFDAYIWRFVDGVPIAGRRRTTRDLPSETKESKAMSDDLKRRRFRFVGPTVCYAYMQAAGLVNDHVTTCFRYSELAQSSPATQRGLHVALGQRPVCPTGATSGAGLGS